MRIVITANGQGTRMKGLTPLPKHELYYGDKKIIDHLLSIYPEAEVLTGFPSNSRKETLAKVKDYTDCLIIDCDIVLPFALDFNGQNDALFYFESTKDKYSSIQTDDDMVIAACERASISNKKSSGVYFVRSVLDLLQRMKTDSIAEAMIGATAYPENYIVKLGDPTDYYEALNIKPGSFTGNKIIMNENTVIKYCKTGIAESNWYYNAAAFNVPKVCYADNEMIITERIYPTTKPTAEDFIRIIDILKATNYAANGQPFQTYLDNIPDKFRSVPLKEHPGTFFHGDLSTTNVLKNSRTWLIDPNYKDIFGSWLTDAGKAIFSFIAYEQDYPEAKKIADYCGKDVWPFAVAEGLRVCKYKPEYISIVNNIAELCR